MDTKIPANPAPKNMQAITDVIDATLLKASKAHEAHLALRTVKALGMGSLAGYLTTAGHELGHMAWEHLNRAEDIVLRHEPCVCDACGGERPNRLSRGQYDSYVNRVLELEALFRQQ